MKTFFLAALLLVMASTSGPAMDLLVNGDFEKAGAPGSQIYGPGWQSDIGFNVLGPGGPEGCSPYTGNRGVVVSSVNVNRGGTLDQAVTVRKPGTYTVTFSGNIWEYTQTLAPFGGRSWGAITLAIDGVPVSYRQWESFFDLADKQWHPIELQWTGPVNSTVSVRVVGQSFGAAGGGGAGVVAFDGLSLDVSAPISPGPNYLVNGGFEQSPAVGSVFFGFNWGATGFAVAGTPWLGPAEFPGSAGGGSKAAGLSSNNGLVSGTLTNTCAIPAGYHRLVLLGKVWQYDIFGFPPSTTRADIELLTDGVSRTTQIYVSQESVELGTWTPIKVAWAGTVGSSATVSVSALAKADHPPDDWAGLLLDDFILQDEDLLPPPAPVVTDDGLYTGATDRLHCSWSSSDPGSGIQDFWYCVGTTPGASNVVNWLSVGHGTSVVKRDLSLVPGQTYYFSVKCMNNQGLWSAVSSSDGITVQPPLTLATIGEAKGHPDGTIVRLANKAVSMSAEGVVWIQESNRSAGIRVNTFDYTLPGYQSKMTVVGTLATIDGERVIDKAATDTPFGILLVKPLVTGLRDMGGQALNPYTPGVDAAVGLTDAGLYVKVAGRVTSASSDYWYLDDGSGLLDGTSTGGAPNAGVRVLAAPSGLAVGDLVSVTGVSRIFLNGAGKPQRALQPAPNAVTKL